MGENKDKITTDQFREKKGLRNLVIIFFIILILSLGLKSWGLNHALYDDEGNYAFAAVNNEGLGYVKTHYSGLMSQWTYEPFVKLFGVKTEVYRLVPLFFSTLALILMFFLVKKIYNAKVALISSVLVLLSFYHHFGSLQIDIEGSLMTLFYVIVIWLYIYMQENKQMYTQGTKYSYLSLVPLYIRRQGFIFENYLPSVYVKVFLGLSLGLCLLIKHNALLLFVILFVYDYLSKKNFVQSIKDLFLPFTMGIIIFIFFYFIMAYLTGPEFLAIALKQGARRIHFGFSLLSALLIFFWLTPYLTGLFLVSSFDPKTRKEKHYDLFLTWILANLFFYICIIKYGDFSKYTMNIIIPICILGGLFISKINFKRTEVIFASVVGIFFYALTYYLNVQPYKIVPRLFDSYVNELKHFNFNFLFTYTGPSGPLMGISMLSFLIILTLSFAFIFFYFVSRQEKTRRILFITFLALSLGFNLFLITEFYFHPAGPNIDQVHQEMLDYFNEKGAYPIFSNDQGILFLLDHHSELSREIDNKSISLSDYELDDPGDYPLQVLKQKGKGSALVLNWPPLPTEAPLKKFLQYCQLEKTFVSKMYEGGYAFSCEYK